MNAQPIPPESSRADALGRLERERWHAADAGESTLVADIERRIARLSASGSASPPQRETTAATPPREAAAKKTAAHKPTTKGNPRVRSAR